MAPGVGDPTSAFAVRDFTGKPVKLVDFRGRTVVLEWTTNGCPFVRHVYDSGVMQSLQTAPSHRGLLG